MSTLHLQQPGSSNCPWRPYRQSILESPLFAGLSEDMLPDLLQIMQARLKMIDRKTRLFSMGDDIHELGILLRGSIEVSRQDILGNSFIVTTLEAPSLFAEVLACAGLSTSPVHITVQSKATILLLDFRQLLTDQRNQVLGKPLLIQNMMQILARKNLMLSGKLDVMSKRSIRAKVAAVLLDMSTDQHRLTIDLPYNRQQLADYLAVDRSALSRELSAMKHEGLIVYQRQHFYLLEPEKLASLL